MKIHSESLLKAYFIVGKHVFKLWRYVQPLGSVADRSRSRVDANDRFRRALDFQEPLVNDRKGLEADYRHRRQRHLVGIVIEPIQAI